MKNLKIKFGLLSLLAVLTASIFLTSCEQDSVLDNIATEQVTIESSETFKLAVPRNMSEEAIGKWLDNLDYDEVKEMAETVDLNEVEARGCSSWSSWRHYRTTVSCNACSNPPHKHKYYYSRYRYCDWGVHIQYGSNYSCKAYC